MIEENVLAGGFGSAVLETINTISPNNTNKEVITKIWKTNSKLDPDGNEITIDVKHYETNLPNIIEAIVIDRYIEDKNIEKLSVEFYNEYIEYYKLNKKEFPLIYFDKKNWQTPFYLYNYN